MQKFGHTAVGVTRGSVQLFSAFEDNGIMWSGHGPRRETRNVKFSEPFLAPPLVHVSISMWDIESRANQRADITAENITPEGFEILFRTWGDTRVARIRADWMAIGSVRHEDDFDL
ncbi:H-type lectin domain-containing protein [Paracoccus saliphilus]|uniref:H-type lectin domain-containing protein n=1 Tax=Paracoccus saliphilus TaxID=405559 RepID=A0AA46A5U5_9RHOB|nr:H-type lectin domain-containing protein [Paracoccus saliphilus]WCR04604.1 H-type lectin domain-containing protein [Paracoccus saliphilus]SIS87352.1 H-type lectin domain-containing protein [Paracoccus saliphilus]